jgi:uncharacterized phage protein (TIGR01671 family)
MNREIKFRGKDTTGEWWYGNLLIRIKRLENGRTIKSYAIYEIESDSFCSGIVPETIGEFTRLQDMNGKEIYEGDIVEAYIEQVDFITEVKWGTHSRGWTLKCDRRNERWGTIKYYALPASHNIEVVGNIHDNKELLTKK